MCYHFAYVGADLRKPAVQPGISKHCRTTERAGVSRDMPVHSPSFHRVLIPALPQSAGSGWVGLGAWFCAKVVYSSKDSNPPRYYWSSWSSRTCYRYTRPTTHTASSRGCSTSYTTVTTIWLCSLALYTTTLFIIWLRFLSQFSKLVV